MTAITIAWRYPTELQVVVDVQPEPEPVVEKYKNVTNVTNVKYSKHAVFKQFNWKSGDQETVTILDDRDGYVDLKFSDGFIAYHVEKTLYKEVA